MVGLPGLADSYKGGVGIDTPLSALEQNNTRDWTRTQMRPSEYYHYFALEY